MLFGKGTQAQRKPQRGMAASSRRQLISCLVLLAALCFLSYRLALVGRKEASPPGGQGDPRQETTAFGTVLDEAGATRQAPAPGAVESGDGVHDFGAPLGPRPPDPFVERPEVLALAARRDRTLEIEEKTLVYLFQKIRSEVDREGGGAFHRRKPDLGSDRGDRVFEELLKDPEKHRGKLVELKGNVVSSGRGLPLRLRGLDAPNPSGLDRAFESYFLGSDGKYYLVATARKRVELEHKDAVRLRAYFCQLYTGQVLYKGDLREGTIPFLVGDDYEILEQPHAETPSILYLPLVGAVAVVAAIIAILFRNRSRAAFEARRLAAKARMPKLHRAAGVAPAMERQTDAPPAEAPAPDAGGGAVP